MGTYRNIMEMLVEEEVIRQCKALPARTSSYLNPEELVAFALNQLPPLYATSEQGLEYQVQKGKVKYAPQISQAVQRAIVAVRRDPLRRHTPLQQSQTTSLTTPLNDVLLQVRQLLKDDDVEWETLPSAVERALKRVAFRAAQGSGALWQSRSDRSAAPAGAARVSRSPQTGAAASAPHPMPAVPVAQAAPVKPAPEVKGMEYGWDDPLYCSR